MKNKIQLKKRKGFTLIEMVIVITIIGILSSIAVTKYAKVQENAKQNADYATASNLATAAMIALGNGETDVDVNSLKAKGYIQFVPKSKTSQGSSFTINKDGDSVTVLVGGKVFYPRESDAKVENTNKENTGD